MTCQFKLNFSLINYIYLLLGNILHNIITIHCCSVYLWLACFQRIPTVVGRVGGGRTLCKFTISHLFLPALRKSNAHMLLHKCASEGQKGYLPLTKPDKLF